jgi:hypothetical protein
MLLDSPVQVTGELDHEVCPDEIKRRQEEIGNKPGGAEHDE